jgi:hypothetical protein
MDAKKLDTKVSYLNDSFLPEVRFEIGPMRFYPMATG